MHRHPEAQRRRGVLALVVACVVGLPVAVAGLALATEPAIAPRAAMTPADAARALALLRAHDPRRQRAGAERLLVLGMRELELLLGEAARHWPGARARVELGDGAGEIVVAAPLPVPLWLNLRLRLVQTEALPRVERIAVGRLPLPAAWAAPLVRALVARQPYGEQALWAADMVRRVWITPAVVRVHYAWDAELPARVLGQRFDAAERKRLRAYSERLAALAGAYAADAEVALPRLMAPLFALARERSAAGDDARAENRAALLALTLHANRRRTAALVPGAHDWPAARWLRPTLDGREDFALHFLVSALLVVEGTSPLSRALGVYKEVADARVGSGFSFNDVAADRAGTRLGELMLEQPRAVQERLAAAPADVELMPPWRDLPEFVSEREFLAAYGGVGGAAYERMIEEIDRRVGALHLLR